MILNVLKVQLDQAENEIKFGRGCQATGFSRESLSKSRLRHQPISLSSPLTDLILTSQWSDQCPLSASRTGVELIAILFVTVQNCSQSYPIYPGSERVCQGEGFLQITCFWYLLSRIVFDQVFWREDAFWAPLQIESPSVDRQSVTSLDHSMVTTLTVVSVTILVPNRKFHVRHPVLSLQMCFRVSEFVAKKFTSFQLFFLSESFFNSRCN